MLFLFLLVVFVFLGVLEVSRGFDRVLEVGCGLGLLRVLEVGLCAVFLLLSLFLVVVMQGSCGAETHPWFSSP